MSLIDQSNWSYYMQIYKIDQKNKVGKIIWIYVRACTIYIEKIKVFLQILSFWLMYSLCYTINGFLYPENLVLDTKTCL